MFQSFEEQEDTPRDIHRFESRWLIALVLSVVIAAEMFDYSVSVVGAYPATLINAVLFAEAIVLMGFAARRRSNVARLLMIPFTLLILFYDLSHLGVMMHRGPTPYYAVGRIAMMVAAIYLLFTPASRAWFAGKPLPPGALEEEDED
jgi:hypothetical protein